MWYNKKVDVTLPLRLHIFGDQKEAAPPEGNPESRSGVQAECAPIPTEELPTPPGPEAATPADSPERINSQWKMPPEWHQQPQQVASASCAAPEEAAPAGCAVQEEAAPTTSEAA
eukprot:7193222-Pyramimonas_sp.AAC.1